MAVDGRLAHLSRVHGKYNRILQVLLHSSLGALFASTGDHYPKRVAHSACAENRDHKGSKVSPSLGTGTRLRSAPDSVCPYFQWIGLYKREGLASNRYSCSKTKPWEVDPMELSVKQNVMTSSVLLKYSTQYSFVQPHSFEFRINCGA